MKHLHDVLDELRDEVDEAVESIRDGITAGNDRLARVLGEDGTGSLADLTLDDDERAALDARALGRTLKAIDRLPVA